MQDFSSYARSLGVTGDLMSVRTFLGTSIRHRGTHVGNFYLTEKEDGQAFSNDAVGRARVLAVASGGVELRWSEQAAKTKREKKQLG